MSLPKKNLAASIRQRLLNVARERREDFSYVLTRYGNERLLARLAASGHAVDYVLKGATLFTIWTGEPHRATRDLDFLGFGAPTLERAERAFREICATKVEADGLEFTPDSLAVERIREQDEYDGIRITVEARLAGARIPLQVDVGFGDVMSPDVVETEIPSILAFPAPKLRAYPRPSVISEKVHAMVKLGLANSRMKDFFDVWLLSRDYEFSRRELADAVRATFERRETSVPEGLPLALTSEFSNDHSKRTQWAAFVSRSRPISTPPALPLIVTSLASFIGPIFKACAGHSAGVERWPAGGPWE